MMLRHFISKKKGIAQYFNPTLFKRNDARTLLNHEQPYKKGSSSSIWKKTKKILIPNEPFICHPLQ